MRPKVALVIIVAGIALAAVLTLGRKGQKPITQDDSLVAHEVKASAPVSQAERHPVGPIQHASNREFATSHSQPSNAALAALPRGPSSADKLERLAQTREYFRALAAGDHAAALQAAKAVTNSVERETALLALVTEWTHGELRAPRRARGGYRTARLEAGLGMELAKDPDLALLWANELMADAGREALIREIALAMVASDPNRAFALLREEIPGAKQAPHVRDLLASWGGQDTEAALNWADQLSNPAERDSALAAIRTQAPVGIGAVLNTEGGYPGIVENDERRACRTQRTNQ